MHYLTPQCGGATLSCISTQHLRSARAQPVEHAARPTRFNRSRWPAEVDNRRRITLPEYARPRIVVVTTTFVFVLLTVNITRTYNRVMRTEAPALLPIFRSQLQGQLLAYLLLNPTREYTVTDLARALSASKQTTQQEVERLVVAHVLRDRRQGRNRLISANPDHPAYTPLTQLALLTFGPHNIIADEFGAIPGVERVLIFGSWAARYCGQPGPPPHDIDVLVIGDTSRMDVFDAADRAQKRIGTPVNPEQASPAQWADPGEWALLAGIKERPYVQLFPQTEATPA